MAAEHLESVERVMRVLGCFTLETPELRLTDLCERLDMPKSQVHRIVSTLMSGTFLSRDPDTKRYRLGLQVFQLGMVFREKMPIHRIVLPYLQELMQDTQETAGLVVPDDFGPMCFEQVESPRLVKVYSPLGKRLPWYADTSPKLLLAFLPDSKRAAIMAREDFNRAVHNSLFSHESLLRELECIQANGYHVGGLGLRQDVDGRAVSAPVFDHRHEVVGAINVAGPSQRMSSDVLEHVIRRVVETAQGVSKELGCNTSSPKYRGLVEVNGSLAFRGTNGIEQSVPATPVSDLNRSDTHPRR